MKRSLRFYAGLYSVIVAALIAAAATAALYEVRRYVYQSSSDELAADARQKARAVSQFLRFYQGVAERMAAQPIVLELMLFGDAQAAERWSVKLQNQIPELIGAALFSSGGVLYGPAVRQRVGSECLHDMAALVRGGRVHRPPVHRQVLPLAHFDVTAPVMRHGDRLGILFMSISLESLRRSLGEVIVADEAFVLRDADDSPMLTLGDGARVGAAPAYRVAVPDSDWWIEYRSAAPALAPVYVAFGWITVTTVAGVVVLLVLLVSIATRRVNSDLDAIRRKLEAVAQGEAPAFTAVYLKETQDMMPAIDAVADRIHHRQQELAEQSQTDALTGLANRRALHLQLPQCLALAARGTPVCVAVIDLDHLKRINDARGHAYGDRVLRELAEVLRHHMRESDLAARLGGDEFVVVLMDIDRAAAPQWFERLRRGFAESVEPAGLARSLSIGYVCVDQSHAIDATEVLRRADAALYGAKARGRDRATAYSEALETGT